MLGNHDIELALPGTRQLFLDRIGPGRIEFIYDKELENCFPRLIMNQTVHNILSTK